MNTKENAYKIKQEIESEFKNKSISFILSLVAVITGLGTAFAAFLLTSNFNLINVGNSDLTKEINTLNQMQIQLINTDKKLKDISTVIEKRPDDLNLINFDSRITRLENQTNAISSTILQDPEKAITASLLRKKQIETESTLIEIKDSEAKINQRIDNITLTVVAIPLIGFVLSLIGSGFYFIYNNKKSRNN